ncbi:DUF448 domain-containing protein [Sphingomonas lenta]|uniref:Transcription terminating nucleic-acid-binding protein n=1 Tax=Sphingomonas lenta TaxID=1141887 RepID=A0A2A2SCZ8_9SPHN|nr:DUF448 domain-containing protein [Sphingomonas lenta]PAX07128.1 transcription terminating nucleic-acid-binding protein [Sphingomonas lenta]
MRTPRNEARTLALTADQAADGPVRRCVLSGDRVARASLIRLALGPDGSVHPDIRAKAPGRGAWIGIGRAELEQAVAKGRLRGALSRAFKSNEVRVLPDLPERIEDSLRRHALDRLGLEAKSGTLLTGSDKIEAAARSGQLHALYHAADAREDGMRKLAQGWRVGSDREGSDLKGLVLPLERTILSLALGRENVVHLGLTDRAAAKRVGDALDRWLRFIGPESSLEPCGTAPQGASALPAGAAPTAVTN